jgi:UDP-glucose 4-epimerase
MAEHFLITGGAGFIGSHIPDALLSSGNYVICIDNLDSYYNPEIKRKNIEPNLVNENYAFIEGDIRDKNLLKKVIHENSIDYIFHNAAQAGVRISVKDPVKPHEVNTTGTLNILMASLDSSVKKVINASSSSVYGKVKYLPFDEGHPNQPVSPYGVSKLAAEHYCRVFYEVYGLRTTSLRYFTVYGPRMRPDLAISIFTRKALKNEPIEIFGTGEKTRDFTYISDVVHANMCALSKGDGEIYNIGSGNRISVSELADKIIAITKSKSNVIHAQSQKGDAEHTLANVEKAKNELGWSPRVGIDEGLTKYVEWWKSVNERYAHGIKE